MNEKKLSDIELFRRADIKGKIILMSATWFGSGLVPFAPGTWGSLAALPFAALAYSSGFLYGGLSLLAVFILSIPISGSASKYLQKEDPPSIVIDEVAGIFITLFLLPVSWMTVTAGFILFRLFDIIKPFPVGFLDRKIKGGTGIVLDDIMAGIYANICLQILLTVFK